MEGELGASRSSWPGGEWRAWGPAAGPAARGSHNSCQHYLWDRGSVKKTFNLNFKEQNMLQNISPAKADTYLNI